MAYAVAFATRGANKPEGGFQFLTPTQMSAVWWSYRRGLIRLYDLRVWFAAQEMVARRLGGSGAGEAFYGPDEVSRLVGGAGGRSAVLGALRRLERAGLLEFRNHSIKTPLRFPALEAAGLLEMVGEIRNQRRRVPVPRRLLRLIAAELPASSIATALGSVMRCLYWDRKEQHCRATGAVKASWLATTFGLSERAIRTARHHLEHGLGFLRTEEVPQWYQNRYGSRVSVNLAFRGPVRERTEERSESAPPLAQISTGSAPPKRNKNPLTRSNNQEPPGAGSSRRRVGEPDLKRVVPEDLADTQRLLKLLSQARERELVGTSESAELAFVGAAEHARSTGLANPPGLFAWLVRQGRWEFVTAADEDRARRRLSEHRYGKQVRESETPSGGGGGQRLSKDARTVEHLTRTLRSRGVKGDPFTHVARVRPDWSLERWLAAKTELVRARTT